MEGKSVVMSALGIGIGVGVGLGLASAPWAAARPASSSREGVTVDRIEQELRRLLVDGAESKVNFDEFPYYLRFVRSFLRSSVPSLPSFLPSAAAAAAFFLPIDSASTRKPAFCWPGAC
jgi:hypothetical protein